MRVSASIINFSWSTGATLVPGLGTLMTAATFRPPAAGLTTLGDVADEVREV